MTHTGIGAVLSYCTGPAKTGDVLVKGHYQNLGLFMIECAKRAKVNGKGCFCITVCVPVLLSSDMGSY